jgi:hypothetical protein
VPAEPRSVAAPELDALWANAAVGANADRKKSDETCYLTFLDFISQLALMCAVQPIRQSGCTY